MKAFLILLVLALTTTNVHAGWFFSSPQIPQPAPSTCLSAREFTTAFEYLKDQSALAGNDLQAKQIALKVADGCTGSALRFINTVRLLEKSDLPNQTIIETAVTAAQSTDSKADAFFTLFQLTYLPKYLDLDLHRSLKLSRDLSLQYQGTSQTIESDFRQLVEFCLSQDGLGLAKPQCAEWTLKLMNAGQSNPDPLYPQFKTLFDFFETQKDLKLDIKGELTWIEKILSINEKATENFIQGYRLAVDEKGLRLPVAGALNFGWTLAQKSKPSN